MPQPQQNTSLPAEPCYAASALYSARIKCLVMLGDAVWAATCACSKAAAARGQDELTDLEWLRLAPDLEPGSFLRAEDGSNILDPSGQCVVFVKEG